MKKIFIQATISVSICIFSSMYIHILIKDVECEKNMYIEVSSEDMLEMKSENDELLVYYFKKDCMPCSIFKEYLNNQIKKYEYEIYAINIMDKSNDGIFLEESKIEYTPTLIKFKNGIEVKRLEGNNGEKTLSEFLSV